MTFAGIDLGNSRVKVAIPDAQGNPVMQSNEVGELYTLSIVYFDEDRTIVGTEALHAGLANPERCVQNWKRHMGTEHVLHTADDGTEFRAKDIARILLQHVADNFQQKTGNLLGEAAISVPANYTDQQKAETIEAARACGINVIITPHEPTAATFGNMVQDRGDGLVAIFDLGGGTFDVSVVSVGGNTVEVLATNGESHLGGQDFNERLIELVLGEFEREHEFKPDRKTHPLVFQDLHQRVEQVKLALSARESASITFSCDGRVLSTTITREVFKQRVEDLVQVALDRASETLAEAGISPASVRDYVPVGGASQTPSFLDGIEARFGKKPAFHVEPYYAVALGCVTMARLTKESEGEQITVNGRKLPPLNHRLNELTAHPIGVGSLASSDEVVCSVILPKGTPMPSDQTLAFQLAEEGQTGADIRVLQATDGVPLDQCQELGFFQLGNLNPVSGKPHRIDIRCKIDKNGMLTAVARDPNTGQQKEMTVKYKSK